MRRRPRRQIAAGCYLPRRWLACCLAARVLRASPHLTRLHGCPRCHVALPICKHTDKRPCPSCGLVWQELTRETWIPLPEEAVAQTSGAHLRIVRRSAAGLLGSAVLASFAGFALSPVVLLYLLIEMAITGRSSPLASWLVLAIIVPLG